MDFLLSLVILPFIYLAIDLFSGMPGWLSGSTSAFGSGRDPEVLGLSPALGFPQGACLSPMSAYVSASLSVSLLNK